MTRLSWTQPSCADCWRERNPDREPMTLIKTETETCVYCGASTTSGIYVRVDPALAPHPTLTKDES
jgi:hypothetical protein